MKKILVIDDEAGLVELVKTLLTSKGHDVMTAGDGDEGLQKVKNENPDLIILDIQMPKMDGHTFVREFKKIGDLKKTPIIVFTAKEKMQDVFKIEGVHDYILKPFKAEKLLEAIKKHLK